MAPKYKLTYFNAWGLGESIRFLLSYMEEDFEDVRIELDKWESFKSKTPYGRMPILEEDGKSMTQSLSINRYLGKKAGLAGNDDFENLQIDMMADTIYEARLPVVAFYWESNEDIKKAKKEICIKETLPFYLKKFDDVVKENGGYLANKKLSWADLFFVSLLDSFSHAADVPDITADYPSLHALKEKVLSIPQIKKWIEKRPQNPYLKQNK